MLQTSLLLMKSLNKTETPIFLSVVCSLFPRAIFLTFILYVIYLLNNSWMTLNPSNSLRTIPRRISRVYIVLLFVNCHVVFHCLMFFFT